MPEKREYNIMRELNVNEIEDVNGGIWPFVIVTIIIDNIAAGWNEAHENCGC
jgi:lactobin A/cerein 7B family class IIb bacteriocin